MQLQSTIGRPLLPAFESIEWFYQQKNNFSLSDSASNEFIDQKIIGKKLTNLNKYLNDDGNNFYTYLSNNIDFNVNFVNKDVNKNITTILKNNINNLIAKNYNLSIINLDTRNYYANEINSRNIDTINIENNKYKDIEYFNLFPLYEVKILYDLIKNIKIIKQLHNVTSAVSIQRPLIFSLSNFIGSAQYAGKWLGKVYPSFEGMKMSLLQTMKYNMYGNPHVVHEACDNINNPTDLDLNIDNQILIYNKNEQLCLRWIQMISVFPHARVNFDIRSRSQQFTEIFKESVKLRYSLSLYIYSYFIKISLEGGSLIRPLFLDFTSKKFLNDILELDKQFMIGSNIMANPVFEYGIVNSTGYNLIKSTFFTSDKFYDFYTGEFVNKLGVGFYDLNIPLDKISLYLKGGLITPVQSVEDNSDYLNKGLLAMKHLPIQLIISMDSNFQSTGRILIDDGITSDSIMKKMYYKMEIIATFTNNNFIIFFNVNSMKYKLPSNEYSSINQISIYGYTRVSVRKITIINRNSKVDMIRENIHFDDTDDILIIKNLNIKMDVDSKIVIS